MGVATINPLGGGLITTKADYLDFLLCTGCQYCKGCPQDIEISEFLLSYNQKILSSKEDANNNIKWHWGINKEQTKNCFMGNK